MLYTASNNLRSWRTTTSGGLSCEQHVGERHTLMPSRVKWVHGREQPQRSKHHLVWVLLAEGVKDPHGCGLNRLDTAVSKEHHAQVRPLRVLGVG
jgi:hypothetical protein